MRELNVANGRLFGLEDLGHNIDDVLNVADRELKAAGLYEELRGLAGEYKVPVWTATQAGRAALEEDIIEADKIAASYGKVMVSDFIMSLSRKVQDKLSGIGFFIIFI